MDEGFLIWIIPSMYLTHEAVIWVVLLVLSFLLSSGLIQIFSFLLLYYIFLILPPVYYSTDLLLLPYYTQPVFCLTLHFITALNLLTCLLLILYGYFSYRISIAS